MAGDKLLDATIAYDTELITPYKDILTQELSDEARDFIENLLHVEERDIITLKKTPAMHYL